MKNTFGYVNELDFLDEENEIDVKRYHIDKSMG